VPAVMMLVLSLIHSEIVATSSWRPTDRLRIKRSRRSKKKTSDANSGKSVANIAIAPREIEALQRETFFTILSVIRLNLILLITNTSGRVHWLSTLQAII